MSDYDEAVHFIDAGLRLSQRDILRQRLIMALERPNWGLSSLSAGDNFLADILADPDLAELYRQFFFPLGLADAPATSKYPAQLLPWGYRDSQKVGSDALASIGQEPGLVEVRDFIGRSVAHQAGAALVGAARLDENYIYKRDYEGRLVSLNDGHRFEVGPDSIKLPRRADRVLLLGFVRDPNVMGLNPGLAKLRPVVGWLNLPQQLDLVLRLADYITGQGFLALPSAGGLVLAAHLAVLAGLGELGRQGLLVTPEYGPNLRLFSIITDYPFIPGAASVFGVADYCETCQRCINECPAKAIGDGHRQPGLYQWPVKRQACFEHWLEKSDACRKCIEICPYTREPLVGSASGRTISSV